MPKLAAGDLPQISSREHNAVLDMLAWWRQSQAQFAPGGGAPFAPPLLLRNDSGVDVDQQSVLAIRNPIVLPSENANAFNSQVTFSGEVPSSTDFGNFALPLEPIPDGKIGRAAVTGVWPTTIIVEHESQEWVEPRSSISLHSDWVGGAQIVWKESGTGQKRAIIRLGTVFHGPIEAVTNETIAVGGNGQVQIYFNGVGTGFGRTAHLVWAATGMDPIGGGTQVYLRYARDRKRLVIQPDKIE